MLYFFNLLFLQLFPGFVDWILRLNAVANTTATLGPVDTAKALSALAGILILGLGGVLMIALSGRWLRRFVFSQNVTSVEPSEDSKLGKLDWATASSVNDGEKVDKQEDHFEES